MRKPWYRRWWGVVLIILIILGAVTLSAFGFIVRRYYDALRRGEFELSVLDAKQEVRVELLQAENDPSVGRKDAPVTIVAFEDFECPYCRQAQPLIKKLIATKGSDIRFVYKDFPLTAIHPRAQSAAEAGQCAFEQGKFWEFHDELFASQDRLSETYYRTVAKKVGLSITSFNECFASGRHRQAIANDVELGRTLGVVGTPTFYINGELFAQGYSDELERAFTEAIEYIKRL